MTGIFLLDELTTTMTLLNNKSPSGKTFNITSVRRYMEKLTKKYMIFSCNIMAVSDLRQVPRTFLCAPLLELQVTSGGKLCGIL